MRFGLLLVAVGGLLGCSGLGARALDLAGVEPELPADLKASFQKQFVDSCARGLDGVEAKVAKAACTCAAEELIAKKSTKELMKLASGTEAEWQREAADVVKQCLK